MEHQIRALYRVKTLDDSKRVLLNKKPYLSLPVAEMPTKSLKRKARKFNRNFKDEIDWSYDGKDKYFFE